MWIHNQRWRLVAVTTVVLLCYSAPYAAYRFVYPGAVLEYVGGHVIRPSFVSNGSSPTAPDFTFDAYSRSFGNSVLTGSFVSQSLVTRLASRTGLDIAGPLNDLFYPLARIDHLFTGRYCRFKNEGWVPFFTRPRSSKSSAAIDPPAAELVESITIDLSEAESVDFDGFISRQP